MPIPIDPRGFEFEVQEDVTAPAGVPASILPLVVVGYCTDLTVATPTAFASPGAIAEECGQGIGAECGSYLLGTEGNVGLIHMLNPDFTTDGAYGTIGTENVGTSTSAVTADGTVKPSDHLLVRVKFPTGGTVGTAGIKYQASIDDGYSYFTEVKLGTATAIDLSQYGAGKYNLAAGTIETGYEFFVETSAPEPDTTQMQTALRTLRDYTGSFGSILFAQPITGALVDVIKAEIEDLWNYNVFLDVIWSVRVPNDDESLAQYRDYIDTEFGAYFFQNARLCSGGTYVYSGRYTASTGRVRPLRSRGWSVARDTAIREPQALLSAASAPPGVFIKDAAGNTLPRCFDEANGGLFSVLNRTCGTKSRKRKGPGVYVPQDLVLYAPNSDWVAGPYAEVVNHLIRAVLPTMESASEPENGYDAPPAGPLPTETKENLEAKANAIVLKNGKDEGRCHDAQVVITGSSNARIDWELTVVPNRYNFNGARLTVKVSQSLISQGG